LEQDYTDEEIEDNLFDVDFAIEFAESLMESFMRLDAMCEEVAKVCLEKKGTLDKVLTWG